MAEFKAYDPSARSYVFDESRTAREARWRRAARTEWIMRGVVVAIAAAAFALAVWGVAAAESRRDQADHDFRSWCVSAGGTIESDRSRVPVPDRLEGERVGYCVVNGKVVGAR